MDVSAKGTGLRRLLAAAAAAALASAMIVPAALADEYAANSAEETDSGEQTGSWTGTSAVKFEAVDSQAAFSVTIPTTIYSGVLKSEIATEDTTYDKVTLHANQSPMHFGTAYIENTGGVDIYLKNITTKNSVYTTGYGVTQSWLDGAADSENFKYFAAFTINDLVTGRLCEKTSGASHDISSDKKDAARLVSEVSGSTGDVKKEVSMSGYATHPELWDSSNILVNMEWTFSTTF